MDGTAAVVGLWALAFCGAVAGLAVAVVLGVPALVAWWKRLWRTQMSSPPLAPPGMRPRGGVMRELLAVLVAVFRVSLAATVALSLIVLPRAMRRAVLRLRGEADV